MDRQALEERIAHLERCVDDLSAIVRVQAERLDRQERVLRTLLEGEAPEAPPPSQRPPHW